MPAESTFHDQISEDPVLRWKSYPAIIEVLKKEARALGLWNLFLMKEHYPDVGVPLTNLEYAIMAEVMGHCQLYSPTKLVSHEVQLIRAPPLSRKPAIYLAPEATNCAAPDTGNMEVLARYGTQAQKDKWLRPVLEGKTRSAFSMTEPSVASSDATNIRLSIRAEGDEIVLNGRKWWISGSFLRPAQTAGCHDSRLEIS